jgi:hypothetical protein
MLDIDYNQSMKNTTARYQTGPDGVRYNVAIDSEFIAWETAHRTYNREVRGIPCGCVQNHPDFVCDAMKGDLSIERTTSRPSGAGQEKSPEAKQALAEAIAYIAEYKGSWGFILDLRANRAWGTKHFRLSDRQVEVVLNAKRRDEAAKAARDPRQQELVTAVIAKAIDVAYDGGSKAVPEIVTSIVAQFNNGRNLSEKQVAVLDRFLGESAAPKAAPSRVEVGEGWYMVDKTPWKVQHNLAHTGIYAKRLTPDGWEFVSGGIRIIAEKGEPMTREMAAEYGRLYGVCGVCGRELTDETSIEAGIGPICSGRLA